MAIKREFVRKHIGEFTVPVMTVELGEAMEVGLLFTIDKKTGLAMKADNTTWESDEKPAVGVVAYSSLEGFGEAFQLTRKEVLKKGEIIDVYQFGILYADEIVTACKSNPYQHINKPVYLGAGGKLTIEKPSSTNNGIQIVGYVANTKTGAVRIMITDRGAKKAE